MKPEIDSQQKIPNVAPEEISVNGEPDMTENNEAEEEAGEEAGEAEITQSVANSVYVSEVKLDVRKEDVSVSPFKKTYEEE